MSQEKTISPLQQRMMVFTTATQDLLAAVLQVQQENQILTEELTATKKELTTTKEELAKLKKASPAKEQEKKKRAN